MPDAAAGDDVELHTRLGTEDTDEVSSLIACEGGGCFVPGVGDPAAAGHAIRVPKQR
jgi:hypothetical protein